LSVEKVKQEIVDWHQFLHQYFRGEIEATEFSRMERVLTPEFDYVTVWGEVANREEFLGGVPAGYGALPDIEVYVEDVEVREVAPAVYLASFVQVETFPDVPHKRKTSAVLRMEDGIARWILFHLTFIDPTRRPKVGDE
jgi:hypothetical protein